MIAQALALDPKLLIADEPTTALDVTVQAEILKLVRDLRDRIDAGILLITHDMGVVADLADRVLVMQRGRDRRVRAAITRCSTPRRTRTRSSCCAAVPHLGAVVSRRAVVRRRHGTGEADRPTAADATARRRTWSSTSATSPSSTRSGGGRRRSEPSTAST